MAGFNPITEDASAFVIPLNRAIRSEMLPFFPRSKQLKQPFFVGLTLHDGVLSGWNGQQIVTSPWERGSAQQTRRQHPIAMVSVPSGRRNDNDNYYNDYCYYDYNNEH